MEQVDYTYEILLYYLYMIADDNISYSEEKMFDQICNELNVSIDEKKAVINSCGELYNTKADIFDIIIQEKIYEKVRMNYDSQIEISSLIRIIWNLINLGYADSFYSSQEKRIVKFLVTQWDIPLEVYYEFIDIAETIRALTNQKDWVVSTFPKGIIRDKKERKIDNEIQNLLNGVMLIIQEIVM